MIPTIVLIPFECEPFEGQLLIPVPGRKHVPENLHFYPFFSLLDRQHSNLYQVEFLWSTSYSQAHPERVKLA